MRILIVHNQLWAHYKSKLFSDLCQLAPQFGAEVHVAQIALSEKSRANMGEAQENTYKYNYEVLFNDSLENVSTWQRTRALFKKMRQYKPDVLNLTGYYDPAQLLLLFYAKILGVKVIISNESNVRDSKRHYLKEKFKQFVLNWADGFFCFGQSSAAYLEQLGVQPRQILTRKAAVVDNERLQLEYELAHVKRNEQKQKLGLKPHNFIFVGRLIAPKNLLLLIQAFNQLPKNHDWGLILLGEGDQKADLQQFCEQNKLHQVRFLAGVAWYQVPHYLALADVFVLPSISEPWGLVVNEALVCGLPVVVSENCGCVEDLVKNGKNGFVFDPNQVDELTEKLRFFVENTHSITPMGVASRRLVSPFATQKVAAEMLIGISKLMGKSA
ncbi:MAG: glycosyltransferase family 1 protein [Runella slithyformis]|nr:MAG: glycosyltransferase family 1 protein [Runella slithyformis]TAE93951.1 MAG: glycosyltransferase family 1 protein [Runella slithyformis]TAF29826.1 MAG: glycosyltransferase family 1 protein [Runella slithyformis]TAF48823.1 MAG: glycosyltransferase family 1 protein [Runella slithyformis]TAF83406.1 MAG: glycosyltransferase family 1 protein [Runella slithyformis]